MVASLTAEQHELSPCSAFGAGHLPTNCLKLPQNKSVSIQIMLSMAPTEVRAMDLVVLQVLVELAQERDEDIPALVYEARPAGRVAARQRQQQSPAELQGVTVEGHTPGCPTEGANHLCLGSAKHLEFLCLLGSGNPNMQIDCCRMTQYMQLSLSTRSTVMEWGPASHLMPRMASLPHTDDAGGRSGGEARPPALLQQQLHPSHHLAAARPAGDPAGVAVDSPGLASLGVSGAAAPEAAAALLGEPLRPCSTCQIVCQSPVEQH